MKTLSRITGSPYLFWAVLSLPALAMMSDWLGGEATYHRLLHPTGEFAARFMIIAMMISPLRTLFPRTRWTLWLMNRRRHIGVAAFGYAGLHLLFYLLDAGSFGRIVGQALELGIWTGWLAFFIFVPMAITSNDLSVRLMGRRWKTLQRLVYAAALLTLAHWVFIEFHVVPALVHFVPLAILEGLRLTYGRRRRPRRHHRPARA